MSIAMEGARLGLLEDHLTKSLALLTTIKEENQRRKLQDRLDHYEATAEEQIRREFDQQQKDDRSEATKRQIIEDLKDEMRPHVVDTLVAVLRDQIEAELRPKIEAELRAEVNAKLKEERTAALNGAEATSLSQSIEAAGAKPEEASRACATAPNGPEQQTTTKQAIAHDILSLLEEELGKTPTRKQPPPTDTDPLPDYEYYEREQSYHPPPSSPPVDSSLSDSGDIDKGNIIESIESPDPPFQRRGPPPPSGNTTEDDDEHWEWNSAASAVSPDASPGYSPPPACADDDDDDDLLGSCKENAICLDSDNDDKEELPRASAGRKRGRSGEEDEVAPGGWKRQRMDGQDWE
ncbi:MAG: hypothetical protein LQ347_002033 [Umbilicaria vellea]|nr:MAG: hypothetical protein LQ347_002033 [Umbilicaria vellea]